jgi:hypothetical protein
MCIHGLDESKVIKLALYGEHSKACDPDLGNRKVATFLSEPHEERGA